MLHDLPPKHVVTLSIPSSPEQQRTYDRAEQEGVATRVDQIGVEECLFVQCKDHARAVGVEVVRELLGVLPTDRIARPVLVSPAGLTTDAARLALKRNVLVWDDERLDALDAP